MVMLFVPLLVLMVQPPAVQPAGAARGLFCFSLLERFGNQGLLTAAFRK